MPGKEGAESRSVAFPERIDRWDLLIPIGTGGTATVFLARTKLVEDIWREVALKLLHPHLGLEGEGWAQRFLEEAKLAASIRHPHVVSVQEVGTSQYGVHLVMDYIVGDTVSGLLRTALAKRSRIPLPVVGSILSGALLGLHAAQELRSPEGHPLHLVHRDFSPQNVLVGIDGLARLTDFGIAKTVAQSHATTAGVIKGKVRYMSPEQVAGRPLDRRCDVWAAGVVVWELIAMRRLWEQDNDGAILMRIVSEAPPSIRTLCPEVPESVDSAIAKALSVDLESRYASAEDFRIALMDAWLSDVGVADTAEVAEYVLELTKEKRAARDAQVRAVLQARAAAQQEPVASSSSVALARNQGEATAADSLLRRRSWIFASASGGVALALVATLALIRSRATPSETNTTAAKPSPSQTSEYSVSPPQSASLPPSASALEVDYLEVRADANIAAVVVGRTSVILPEPSDRVRVPVSPEERKDALAITATARDGRKAKLVLEPNTRSVEIAFGKTSTALEAPVRGKPKDSPPASGDLAPTPYGKRSQ